MAGKMTTMTADVIVELGKRGLDSFFEWLEEEDEEFDPDRFVQYFIALASVWGHAAQSDDEISEEEEDFLGQIGSAEIEDNH